MKKGIELAALESLDGWDNLNEEQQNRVTSETIAAQEMRRSERESRLALGEHLANVKAELEPLGMWTNWCRRVFHMSLPTAFRYVHDYEVVSNKLPKPIVTAALKMGYELPTRKIESSRLPKTNDQDDILRFLERINTPNKVVVLEHNPDTVTKELLNDVILGFNKLPKVPRTRNKFIATFIGMLMTQFGISHEQSFAPVAIPDHFRVKRGRPRIHQREAA